MGFREWSFGGECVESLARGGMLYIGSDACGVV